MPDEFDFQVFKKKLANECGLDLAGYKDGFVIRRLESCMGRARVKTYFEYYLLISKNKTEYLRFLDSLLINVSEFFRNASAFNAIRGILEEILLKKTENGQKKIRIWSAGCATGEEPYSISILLHEILGEDFSKYEIRIDATDLDEETLREAQNGIYPIEKLKNVSESLVRTYFVPEGKTYKIKEFVKTPIRFYKQDLLSELFPKSYCLIFCRNVLIYIDKKAQNDMVKKFYRSLEPGGYLFLGNTELLQTDLQPLFTTVNAIHRIYRRKNQFD